MEENYLEINRNSWNKRAEVHYVSDFYDNESFIQGRSSLNSIELELLGDVSGKTILHLQCHFGQDTISMSRMGAQTVGVDLSDKSIQMAENLAKETKTNARFICCDIYELPKYFNEKFDIVFSSYGTIGWLPDVNKWGEIISQFLKPGGKFVFAEFHPVVWMFDDDFSKVTYRYFKSDPIIENESGTYTDKDADINQDYVSWNHSLSEVFTALISNNLEIEVFKEYDYSPYNCFNNTIEVAKSAYRIKHLKNHIPMVYSLKCKKSNKLESNNNK